MGLPQTEQVRSWGARRMQRQQDQPANNPALANGNRVTVAHNRKEGSLKYAKHDDTKVS